ncbi:tyrosine-type recombinase/integrase [Neolewinella antarctica]|uniref:Integrase/recombinase XerD n=1 Tax=Neolewinella antarctica TaxID=442734 RepID=A0ABX0XDX0_9BACT|nr:tyrosine-type recombinase/integrase [Neolewinella antarctica]NJC27503.1 integrase/recombinase XerD [Neolewinella antarctica]
MATSRTHLNLVERAEHRAYLAGWATAATALGYATASVRTDRWRIRRFLEWCERHGPGWVEAVTAADLEAYREYVRATPSLSDGGPVSEFTVYRVLRVVQLLFDYLLQSGLVAVDPFAGFTMNRPKRGPKRSILTRAEVTALYRACDRLEERALLALAYGCGLRVGEIERLNVAEVRLVDKLLVVERGKYDKRRVIPLSAGVRRDLLVYTRRRSGTEPAFIRHGRGGRLRRHTIQKWLTRLAERAGVDKSVTVHVLRHTIASHLLTEGMAVEEVRTFLGHSLLATTQRYVQVDGELIDKIVGV